MTLPAKPAYWDDAIRHLSACDPIFAQITATYPDEHLTSKKQLFRTLANAIVGQQISVAAAESIWKRVLTAVGGRMVPARVLAVSPEALRGCGLSVRKVEYLLGAAEAFAGPYKGLRWSRMDDMEIRKRLIDLRGIGPWTADMVLIFTFNRPDILPLLDIGVVRCIERHWNGGEAMDHASMEALAEAWRPFRSVATWYLWRELDAEPVAY